MVYVLLGKRWPGKYLTLLVRLRGLVAVVCRLENRSARSTRVDSVFCKYIAICRFSVVTVGSWTAATLAATPAAGTNSMFKV